jgi:hypothetical protein
MPDPIMHTLTPESLQATIGECEAVAAKMRAQSKAASKQLDKLRKDAVKQGGFDQSGARLTAFDCALSGPWAAALEHTPGDPLHGLPPPRGHRHPAPWQHPPA